MRNRRLLADTKRVFNLQRPTSSSVHRPVSLSLPLSVSVSGRQACIQSAAPNKQQRPQACLAPGGCAQLAVDRLERAPSGSGPLDRLCRTLAATPR